MSLNLLKALETRIDSLSKLAETLKRDYDNLLVELSNNGLDNDIRSQLQECLKETENCLGIISDKILYLRLRVSQLIVKK